MIKYAQSDTTHRYHIVAPCGKNTMCGRDLEGFTPVSNPVGITRSMTCGNCSEKAAANKRARMVMCNEVR